MEYLEINDIEREKEEILEAFNKLIDLKAVVPRPFAKQWRFLKVMKDVLFHIPTVHEFGHITRQESAQLKFEVEDRLRRYYLRPGFPVKWIFTISHKKNLLKKYPALHNNYPTLCGYALLVRKNQPELSLQEGFPPKSLFSYLESIIERAVEAEFSAYYSLPEVTTDELEKWFLPTGPAFMEIMNILKLHEKKKWVINNEYNPSTKRLIRVRVKEVRGSIALIKTTEYWYLNWWSVRKRCYIYAYRETNYQKYILRQEKDFWRVDQNIRPAPRSSTPNRRYG